MSWSNATSMASEVESTPSRARAAAALPRSNVMVAFSLAIYFILPFGSIAPVPAGESARFWSDRLPP